MSNTSNYTCCNCGGPLHFDSSLQKLKCDYCESSFTVEEVEKFFQAQNEEAIQSVPVQEGEIIDEIDGFICNSCHASLIGDASTGATICPYCNNPTLIPSRFSNTLKPNYVIPFQLKKEDAIEALEKFTSHKFLLPSQFKAKEHLQEIKGMYAPYWLFYCKVHGDYIAHTTNTEIHHRGDYEIISTHHFQVVRRGNLFFEKVPMDSQSKLDDAYMQSLEPYDYSKLVPFEFGYLAGYYADRYDISQANAFDEIKDRLLQSAIKVFESSIYGYQTVLPVRQNYQLQPQKTEYALLPIYYLTTTFQNKTYVFMMNGQTGKMVGDLLVDYKKACLLIIGIILLGTLISFAIAWGYHL